MSWNPFKGSNAAPQTGGIGSWMNMEGGNAMRAAATGELTGEPSAFEKMGFELTRQQRIMGFAGCLIAGFVLSILGSIMLFLSNTTLFAILYSIGVIVSLVGTGFLIGFQRQLKSMFDPVRLWATIVMLIAFVMVWVSAFAIGVPFLPLIFVIILYLAYIWYTLSYIPYARSMVKSIFTKFM